jgi:nucleoside-diphosphate-sugar epimerase
LEIVEGIFLISNLLTRSSKGAILFHCAALLRDTDAKKEFYQINVEGAENILEAAVEEGVKKFVHFSIDNGPSDSTLKTLMIIPEKEPSNEDAMLVT